MCRGDLRSPAGVHRTPLRCGGSNLSTDLLLWGNYIKKCISPVRICRKPRKDARAELGAEMHLQNFEKLQSRKKKVQRLMGRIYEPLLVPKLNRILRSTCTSLSDARGASERFCIGGEAQPTEKGMPSAYPFLL